MTSRPYWLGMAVAAIGTVWVYQASSLPQRAQFAQIGPGFFVTVIGAVLLVLGLLLMWQVHRGEVFEPQETEDADAHSQTSWPALLLTILAAALPLFVIDWIGFPATAALMFLVVTLAFGSRRYLLNLAIGIGFALICWWGFSALGVRLGGLFPPAGV